MLYRTNRLVWFRVRASPRINPISQGSNVDAKITGDLDDRLPRLDHHLHRLSLKLRAEPPTMFRHRTDPLWFESSCPRSLVHPNPHMGLSCAPLVAVGCTDAVTLMIFWWVA